jgi:hypothetical protein
VVHPGGRRVGDTCTHTNTHTHTHTHSRQERPLPPCTAAVPHASTPGALAFHRRRFLLAAAELAFWKQNPANDGAGAASVANGRRARLAAAVAAAAPQLWAGSGFTLPCTRRSPARQPAVCRPRPRSRPRSRLPTTPHPALLRLRLRPRKQTTASPSPDALVASRPVWSRAGCPSCLSSFAHRPQQFSLKQQPGIANLGHQPPPHAHWPVRH